MYVLSPHYMLLVNESHISLLTHLTEPLLRSDLNPNNHVISMLYPGLTKFNIAPKKQIIRQPNWKTKFGHFIFKEEVEVVYVWVCPNSIQTLFGKPLKNNKMLDIVWKGKWVWPEASNVVNILTEIFTHFNLSISIKN